MASVNDDNVGDFTNDLASDIGPLLALFGENMTIQYLSESTTFLDYFIFALAPIGIITAVVSTIRLCGHASLRAFIGRSQEGEGTIEAELCTSTSRDVCELFTKGGVQRVLGRPSILELVYVERDKEVDSANIHDAKTEVGLYLSRNYFEDGTASENPYWQKVKESSPGRPGSTAGRAPAFAPNPNLSLNVGVKKQPSWVFWAIAALGLVLQLGVLVLAGVGVWILDWNLNEAEGSAKDYAPSMYITGTLLLCGGMWSCAALIGQTTDEIRFKRNNQESSQRSRLLWLQPGPQVIGDQSFDPYAYFEDTHKDPLRVWTSSSKNSPDIFELYTFFAILTTLAGYVIQFIGLRGMKGWVSLAQLGITIMMSLLRGLLRIKRLGKDNNALATMPDLVAGHELDWLSPKIVGQKAQNKIYWHVTGRYKNAREPSKPIVDLLDMPSSNSHISTIAKVEKTSTSQLAADVSESQVEHRAKATAQAKGDHLFQIRVRLAHLTGNISFRKLGDSEYQAWEDEYVKVRAKASKLATAICKAAGDLVKGQRYDDIMLCIEAASLVNDQKTSETQLISLALKAPPEFSTAGWRMDSAQLEAALGLWVWSMISDERLLEEDNDRTSRSTAEKIQQARIVSAGDDDDNWDANVNIQSEMNLWLGRSTINFHQTTLTCRDQGSRGLATLFKRPARGSLPTFTALDLDDEVELHTDIQRFCGWSNVQSTPEDETGRSGRSSANSESKSGDKPGAEANLRIQFIDLPLAETSLLDLCAQELFATLMLSLAGLVPLSTTVLSESSGKLRLENESVNTFVSSFQEAELGSSSDAMLCVVPALRQKLEPLDSDKLLSALCKSADGYRQEVEWERAATVLQWACTHFAPSQDKDKITKPSPHFVKSLRATAELYRWSLAHSVWKQDDGSAPSRKTFGLCGIDKLLDIYGSICQSNSELKEIVGRYQEIARIFREQGDTAKDSGPSSFKAALRSRDRTKALYNLCFMSPRTISSSHQENHSILFLAVRNDWAEVVSVLLEMKVNPNSTHQGPSYSQGERTALSYCAELGFSSYIKPLLEHGSAIDEPSGPESQAPLSQAAKNGHLSIVKLLLESGPVDLNRKDNKGKSSLTHAAEGGHLAVTQILLQHGANIEVKDNRAWTPLMWAAFKGCTAVMQLLLAKGANPDVREDMGQSILMLAARSGRPEIVAIFLDRGVDMELMNDFKYTALAIASIEGHESVVHLLLERGANTEAIDGKENTPLMHAVQSRRWAVVQLLVDGGALVNHTNYEGHTPLYSAAYTGNLPTVKLLLDKDANIEGIDSAQTGRPVVETPLQCAIQQGNEDVAQLLIERGANFEPGYGMPPLFKAILRGLDGIVKLLLDNNANLEVKSESGQAPLAYAADLGCTDIVRMLIEKGAKIEERNGMGPLGGGTALCIAADNGNTECLRVLIDKGASLEVKNFSGNTALHLAVDRGRTECVRLLIDKGAGFEVKNVRGESALHIAAHVGHWNCVRMLIEKGARLEDKDNDGKTPLHRALDRLTSWTAEMRDGVGG